MGSRNPLTPEHLRGIFIPQLVKEGGIAMFGDFVRDVRLRKRIGLREFCLKTGRDASNWSKVERALLPPPQDHESLEKIADALGLRKGDSEWSKLFDLAALVRGEIPEDIMQEETLLKSLPLFFRTLRGQKPSEEELKKVLELIRRS
ncbi:MAG: helix-turn-helix transcriptional regulator [bacterium]